VAIITFRDQIRMICPRWLQNGIVEKILYAIGVHVDLLGDAARAAIRKRMPLTVDSEDAFHLMGRDRKLIRGLNEPPASFATRLRAWWAAHKSRGGPYAMLEQIDAYFAHAVGGPHTVRIVYANGQMIEAGGRSTIAFTPPGDPGHWARWWLMYHFAVLPGALDGTWSDPGTWDDGGVWDSDLTGEQVEQFRAVPKAWNAAHAEGTIVMFGPSTADFYGYPGLPGGSSPIIVSVE
jgi:hypothetical protein